MVPGVGAFAACMAGIEAVGGSEVIRERLRRERPVLGICVGMQVLFEEGLEHGEKTRGLGALPGTSTRLEAPIVPHMGWNTVDVPAGSALFAGVEGERFYFVHSYAAREVPGALRHHVGARRAVRCRRRAGGAVARPSSTRRRAATPARSCWRTGCEPVNRYGVARPGSSWLELALGYLARSRRVAWLYFGALAARFAIAADLGRRPRASPSPPAGHRQDPKELADDP